MQNRGICLQFPAGARDFVRIPFLSVVVFRWVFPDVSIVRQLRRITNIFSLAVAFQLGTSAFRRHSAKPLSLLLCVTSFIEQLVTVLLRGVTSHTWHISA